MMTYTTPIVILAGALLFAAGLGAAIRLKPSATPSARACVSASAASGVMLALSTALRPDLVGAAVAAAVLCGLWAASMWRTVAAAVASAIPLQVAVGGVGLALFAAWPPTYWLDFERVHIPDAVAGEPVRMEVTRRIHQQTSASWVVSVHAVTARGLEHVCSASGAGVYRVDAVLPDNLTLGWWTSGACKTLQPGRYKVTTVWRLQEPILRAEIERVSNVFEVR